MYVNISGVSVNQTLPLPLSHAKLGSLLDVGSRVKLEEPVMDGLAGPRVHDDQMGSAIHAARERLGESGKLYSTLADHDDAEVRQSVALSLEYTGEHEPGSPGAVLAAYAAETVAVGALGRAATGEPPLSEEEVKSIGDFLLRIFNGLFDK